MRKTPILETENGRWGNHVYVIKLINEDIKRDDLMMVLKKYNIGTNLHFYPIHKNYYYEKKYPDVNLPNAEWLMNKILTLPLCTRYTLNDINYVADVLKSLI